MDDPRADPGAEIYADDIWARRQEENAFALDPDFLGLMKLGEVDAKHGGDLIGYRLDELQRGRTSIVGHRGEIPRQGAALVPLGDSLLGVLREWMLSNYLELKREFDGPGNVGFGAVREKSVELALERLRIIEQLARDAGQPVAELQLPEDDWPD